MIFKFLKVDRGEFTIGKQSSTTLKSGQSIGQDWKRCFKGGYPREIEIGVRNGRHYYLGESTQDLIPNQRS